MFIRWSLSVSFIKINPVVRDILLTGAYTRGQEQYFGWWVSSSGPTRVNSTFLINQPGCEAGGRGGGPLPLRRDSGAPSAGQTARGQPPLSRSWAPDHSIHAGAVQESGLTHSSSRSGASRAAAEATVRRLLPDGTPRRRTEDLGQAADCRHPAYREFQDRKKSFQLTPRLGGVNTEASLPTWRKLSIACSQL